MESNARTIEEPMKKVPFGQALAYGIGNIPGTILGYGLIAGGLLFPVFSIALGVSPALVGLTAGISRSVDFFTDPLAGYLSDTYGHKFGRRAFVAAGSIFGGICFAAIWLFPTGLSPTGYFYWLLFFSSATLAGWSVVSVPYQALGYEMTSETNERTKLMAYATVMGMIAGTGFNWAYAGTQLPLFGGTANGARWVGCAMAAGIIGFGLLFAVGCKSGARVPAGVRTTGDRPPSFKDFIVSAKRVVKCRPMLFLAAALFVNNVSQRCIEGVGIYVTIYLVCKGDQRLASILTGATLTCYTVTVLLLTAPVVWLARRIGKKEVMLVVMSIMWVGSGLAWICFTPAMPWLVLIPFGIFGGIGNTSLGTVTMSMAADACDHDEFVTGIRDSGMFSAFYNWVSKLGLTVGLGLGGLLVSFSFSRGAVPDHHSLILMKVFLCTIPIVGYGVTIGLLSRYTITRKVLKTIHMELERRRAKSAPPDFGQTASAQRGLG